MPVITLGEFVYGINRSRHRRRYHAWLARLLEVQHRLPVLGRDTHFDEVPGLERVEW